MANSRNMLFCCSGNASLMRGQVSLRGLAWALFCLWLTPVAGVAQVSTASNSPASSLGYAQDRILVQPKAGLALESLASFHAAHKDKVLRTFEGIGRLQVLSVPRGETVSGLIAKYQQSGLVEFAEPDYVAHLAAIPNDPFFANNVLYGLNKIQAPAAWDVLTSASNVVVAVLDSGVRYTHEDLAANMWVNPHDGGHGLNVFTGSNDPNDDNGHGTLMAGVLGAVGNNGVGVVGVAWQVQIMACKCFNSAGNGTNSDIITCINYARTNGARIINASWSVLGSTNFSLAMSNAIYSARNAGIIFVTTCGNNYPNVNIDVTACYPANYNIDNIVTLAYTDATDTKGFLSNYGATNVDLAAPGDQIVSTYYYSNSSYFTNSFSVAGTSFAAAYASGAFALMLAEYPGETHQQIINRVLSATDPLPSLAGKCQTGGRLNLRKALTPIRLTGTPSPGNGPFQLHLTAATNLTCVLQASSDLAGWSSIFTNSTSTTGAFDFADDQATNSAQRFYRAVTAP